MESAGFKIAMGAIGLVLLTSAGLEHLLTAASSSRRTHMSTVRQSPTGVDSTNNAIRKQFMREGDDGSKPRLVFHFAKFRSRTGRQSFETWSRAKGYVVDEDPDGHSVVVASVTPIAAPKFDVAVQDLEASSTRSGGEYDGWECETITSHKSLGIERRGSGDRIADTQPE